MSITWRVCVSESQDQGGRAYMEDFVLNHFEKFESSVLYGLFAVMDGHGGAEAADFVRRHLGQELKENRLFWSEDDQDVLTSIKDVYRRLQSLMWIEREKWPQTINGYKSTSGTTVTVVIIRNNTLYVGHVGDSGLVLANVDADGFLKSEQITKDHKPNDVEERKRIEASGGHLKKKSGTARIVWNRRKLTQKYEIEQIPFLAVARSLGDLWSYDVSSNCYHVSPEPDVTIIKLDDTKHRAFILASDGVWNVIDADESVNILSTYYKENKLDEITLSNPAELIVNYSLHQWKNRSNRPDNVSAIVVTLIPDSQMQTVSIRENEDARNIYSEIIANNFPKKDYNEKVEFLTTIDNIVQFIPINIGDKKRLDDTELLQMFVLSSEALSKHCIAWKDDFTYWETLRKSFENLGVKKFPNLVTYFEHSNNCFEDVLISFSWSVICLQCIDSSSLHIIDLMKFHDWPLLSDFWLTFYKKIINPNLCFTSAQLTQTSVYRMVMEYILIHRQIEIKNFIEDTRAVNKSPLPLFALKKSHSCNTGRLIYNTDLRCGTNLTQNIYTCISLKRSSSLELTKGNMLTTASTLSNSFNSGSDTPPMSPSLGDSSSESNNFDTIDKLLIKHSLSKKFCKPNLSRKRNISKSSSRLSHTSSNIMKSIPERKIVRFVTRRKSRSN